MFGAMIDIYHDEIASAVTRGDDLAIAKIASAFCQRCHYWRPWKIVGLRSDVCPLHGLQAIIDIEFDDGSTAEVNVGHRHGKRRLTVNGESVACDSSADVVHALETPCAFFDGIYYAIEGLVDIAKSQLAEQIGKFDAQFNEYRKKCENEFDVLCRVQKKLGLVNDQLAVAKLRLGRAIDACKIAEETPSFTIRPCDWNCRLVEASQMLQVPASEFFSVADAKQKLSGKSGIYFAWRMNDGKCVYVGKSSNLGSRIHAGRPELVDCRITVIEMPKRDIHTWELFFIWLHQPERNIEVRLSSLTEKHNETEEASCGR